MKIVAKAALSFAFHFPNKIAKPIQGSISVKHIKFGAKKLPNNCIAAAFDKGMLIASY